MKFHKKIRRNLSDNLYDSMILAFSRDTDIKLRLSLYDDFRAQLEFYFSVNEHSENIMALRKKTVNKK